MTADGTLIYLRRRNSGAIGPKADIRRCMVRPWVARGLPRADVRSCIKVSGFDWSPYAPGIMDIGAPAISLADRPQGAIWVTSVRMRRKDRSSISFLILSHTSAGKGFDKSRWMITRRAGKDATGRHCGRRRSVCAGAMSLKMLGCRITQDAAIA